MAARIRKNHSEQVRAKIQTSQLINRITDHALGKLDLSPTQVRAIEVLMKKTLPDLSAVQLDANVSTQPAFTIHDFIVPPEQQ